jgi:hypothetical protein
LARRNICGGTRAWMRRASLPPSELYHEGHEAHEGGSTQNLKFKTKNFMFLMSFMVKFRQIFKDGERRVF